MGISVWTPEGVRIPLDQLTVALDADLVDEAQLTALDSAVVHKAGTETITGTKTFTGSLVANRRSTQEGGAAATMGVAVLVAGTVVVPTTRVTATSRIQLTAQALGTVTIPQALAVTARTPGTSFTMTSADATDTSTVAWELVEAA